MRNNYKEEARMSDGFHLLSAASTTAAIIAAATITIITYLLL